MPSTFTADLLSLGERAAAVGQYEVAYHALAAAMHAAKDAGDRAALDDALTMCEAQSAAIEAIRPPHGMSQLSAHRRGTEALDTSLHNTIASVRARLAVANLNLRHDEP